MILLEKLSFHLEKEKDIGDSSETGFMSEALLLLGQKQATAVFRQKDKRIAMEYKALHRMQLRDSKFYFQSDQHFNQIITEAL